MAPTRIFKCGVCSENIGKTHPSIQCSSCELWLHIKCCGINEKDIAVLRGNKQLLYTCASCSNQPQSLGADSSVKSEISALKSVIDNFISKVENDHISARCDLNNLNTKIDNFITKVDNEQSTIKQTMTDTVASFRTEIASCIKEMKSEILDCHKLIGNIDKSTSTKISALEDENYVLHRRLNRADIIISGLPNGIENLFDPVIKIGSYYNISISTNDINHICYIHKRSSVLVKFNSVSLRDNIMSAYFKTRTIKVGDVVDDNIDLRIYLNDHYGPAAGKLNAICRKLLKKKIINKYRILNGDKLLVKLTKTDGSVVTHNAAECDYLLNNF